MIASWQIDPLNVAILGLNVAVLIAGLVAAVRPAWRGWLNSNLLLKQVGFVLTALGFVLAGVAFVLPSIPYANTVQLEGILMLMIGLVCSYLAD